MKLLLADDHLLFREALILFIEYQRPDWSVLPADTIAEAKKILSNDKTIDIALLDLRMPGMQGMTGLKEMHEIKPDLPVSILSGVAEPHHVKQAMTMGAKAYFPKTLSGKAIVKAIEFVVMTGQRFVPTDETGLEIMPAYYDDHPEEKYDGHQVNMELLDTLTNREKDVMYFLAQGLSNKHIATKLNLQPSTVKIYVGKLCKKLGVQNRTQAALLCQQYGFDTGYTAQG